MDINSDSWDDDVPDEDLIQAFDQATKASAPQPAVSASRGIGVATTLGRTTAPIRGHINHSNSKNAQSALARSNAAAAIDVDDLPSDAFDSTLETEQAPQVAQKPAQSFRQTNLWGEPIRGGRDGRDGRDGKVPGAGAEPRAPASSARLYRADQPAEAPTHHSLNSAALKTWVYPLNLGAIRDYQFSIVKNGLFNNTLVALPTGLGKTFIAATVILNFFRWTCDSKIVFVAPTKPLASQQVDACLNIVGIPRSQTTLLTGETKPVLREEEWETKRLFFMTPQTLQNDLSKGYADPKKIVLLVVDEAHRATGDYAYVKVIEFLRRFSKSFRVLALTATPGSTVEGVQDVIDNLGVSHVEIRTEESIDIRKYVHSRQIDTVVLEPSDEILRLKDLFSKALKPLVGKISQQNIYYGRDPMSINAYGLMKARQDWFNGPGRHVNQGTKSMIMAIFTILQGLAHSIKLLDFHGIRPFYDYLASFRSETEEKGAKGSKYKRQLINDSSFQEMMDTTAKWLKIDGFVGHPKMTHLCDTLLNHFMDAGAGSTTRVIVFTEYRDSAEEITRVLNIHKPLISASLFVGQADSKKSEGMKQKQQIETIDKFKSGTFNVLVATSIGEEGLDIGQVDLIICYDASSSPIRMLQRMGRTGRKRAGKITLLLMKGKEEDNYLKAQDNYEKMQKLICEGSRFNFRHDLSSRIIPRDIKPEVDKRMVEMPFENTQNTSLPEPKARNTRGKKPPKKKFNMPDGVETGFQMASKFGTTSKSATVPKMTKTKSFPEPEPEPEPEPLETDSMAELPDLDSVLLDTKQARELNRLYRDLPFYDTALEEIATPSLTAHPHLQRSLRPTAKLGHGSYTKRCVRLFKKLGMSQSVAERDLKRYGKHDLSSFRGIPVPSFADENSSSKYDRDERGGACSASKQSAKTRVEPQRKRRKVAPKTAKPKANATQVSTSYLSDSVNTGSSAKEDEDSDDDELDDDDSLHDFIVNEDEDDRGGRDDARGEDESVLSDEDDIFETAASSSRGMPKSPTSASWRLPASSSMSSISPQPAGKPFSVAGETLATQETNDDDELPSLDDLLGGRPARGGLPLEKGDRVQDRGMDADKDGDEDIILKTRPKKRSRYAFVEESDSD